MALRTVAGRRTGESADDLQAWLVRLENCPTISQTFLANCHNDIHADEPATWFYVEADAREATARRRCLACGDTHDVLDSGDHWNAPHMWSCPACGQSIAEVAAGLHVEGDAVEERVSHFYHEVVGPYWPAERHHVETAYAELPFPFETVASPPFAIRLAWTLDELLGYCRSWSATARYRSATGSDPVAALAAELAPVWGEPDRRREVTWPIAMRAGFR